MPRRLGQRGIGNQRRGHNQPQHWSPSVVSTRKPESMTPAERDAEIASILARGLVRAHRAPREDAPNSGDSCGEGLELSADASLSVQTRPAVSEGSRREAGARRRDP